MTMILVDAALSRVVCLSPRSAETNGMEDAMFDPEDDPFYDLMVRYDYYREAFGGEVDLVEDDGVDEGLLSEAPVTPVVVEPVPTRDWADDDIPF